jgi:hypothetical protein
MIVHSVIEKESVRAARLKAPNAHLSAITWASIIGLRLAVTKQPRTAIIRLE